MGGNARYADIDAVGGRILNAFGCRNLAGFKLCGHMEGQGVIGFGESGVQAIRNHRLCAADALFGRLYDEQHGPLPTVLHTGKLARRSDHRCNMHIMAAGMHYRHFKAIDPDLLHRGGIGKSRTLLHRQTVHVGAHENDRAIAVFHHAYHTRATNLVGHHHAGHRTQLFSHTRAGFILAERQFGIAVEMVPQGCQRLVIVCLDRCRIIGLRHRRCCA